MLRRLASWIDRRPVEAFLVYVAACVAVSAAAVVVGWWLGGTHG